MQAAGLQAARVGVRSAMLETVVMLHFEVSKLERLLRCGSAGAQNLVTGPKTTPKSDKVL